MDVKLTTIWKLLHVANLSGWYDGGFR